MQMILLGATVSAMFFNKYINKQINNSQSNIIKESEVVERLWRSSKEYNSQSSR